MLSSSKRLRKELESLKKNEDPLIKLNVKEDNIKEWTAIIRGPEDSPYEGFSFMLGINVSSDYPLTPPGMKFITKCFHPNVHFDVSTLYI